MPIVWVLHVGFAWLPVSLAIKSATLFGAAIPATAWLHALTVGAMASMIIGIMSRAALGHTGRPLVTPGPVVVAYWLLTLAALSRVFGPMLAPGSLWLTIAGLLWCLAFLLYLFVYAPILVRPRIDGRPG